MPLKYPRWSRGIYQKCPEDAVSAEEHERQPLEKDELESSESLRSFSEEKKWAFAHRLSVGAIIAANLLLFLASTLIIFTYGSSKEIRCSEKETSFYSPIFEHVEIKKHLIHFNNSFWPDDPPSIFQQPPSLEVEAAWSRLSDTNSIALSAEEVRKLGYDPEATWPIPKPSLEDPDVPQYYGLIDVFHQVHCLNMMRWQAFPDYYGDLREKYKDFPLPWEGHMLHCQYLLLRNILCHADVEVTVFQKFKGWPGHNANFATNRQCRNYEDILEWKEAHQVVPDVPWTEFPDRPIVEVDPEGVLTPWGWHDSRSELCESLGARCMEIAENGTSIE